MLTPADAHAVLAAGAADAATLFASHVPGDVPPVCGLVVDVDHERDAATVAGQLAHLLDGNAFEALAAWHDVLDDARVTVTRYTAPYEFVSAAVVAQIDGGTSVRVWTHTDDDETAALWRLVGHEPEPGVTAELSIDVVRAAAASCRAEPTEPVDADEPDPATEDEGAA